MADVTAVQEFNHAATMMQWEKLCPLLFARDRIGPSESSLFGLKVPEGGLWGVVYNIVNLLGGKSSLVDGVDYLRLNDWIEGGLVERLLRFIIELSPLMDKLFVGDLTLNASSDTSHGWQWWGAITAVHSICSAYNENDASLDIYLGFKQFQTHSMELFEALSRMNHLFSAITSFKPAAETVIGISKLCDDVSLLLIPDSGMAAPKSMRIGGLERPNQSLGDSTHKSEGGLPVQRLVDQAAYVDDDTCEDNQKHRRDEYGFLACMVYFEPSPTDLVRILSKRGYVTSSMGVARALLSNLESLRMENTPSNSRDHFVLNLFAVTWLSCILLASTDRSIDVPKDSIDFGMLFILELMVLSKPEQSGNGSPGRLYLHELPRAIYTAFELEQATGGAHSYINKLIHQIAVIHRRLSSRPGVSKALMNSWAETFVWAHIIHPCISLETVCGNPGCNSIEAPTLQCSRCRSCHYCSKQCQKSDWKFHKNHCAAPKK
ncbi:hypothetical protein DL93DRAFT_2158863 [Clavulina sp. PMI_390]|nr:hypothetical protein DL93DRAFT_2158863 [Clavulina sp. PMI_390]